MTKAQHRVLIVDDDQVVCSTLTKALGPLDLAISCAHTAGEATHQLNDHVFDAVLLDLGLGDGSGLDVLKNARHSNARFVVITADTTPKSLIEAIRAKAFDYIHKPFRIEQVLASVENALKCTDEGNIEVLSARPDWFELSLPCTRECAERIETFMRHLKIDLPGELVDTVITAFRELLMNAVEWGGELDPNRRVRVSCLRTPRMIQYRIADPGQGFKFENLAHAAAGNPERGPMEHMAVREEKGMRPGGLGLIMVRAMADELIFNEDHNEVVLIKYLDTPIAQ